MLRQDNVFSRLYKKAYALGLISVDQYQKIDAERAAIERVTHTITKSKQYATLIQQIGTGETDAVMAEINTYKVAENLSSRAVQSVYAELVYGPYLEREQREIDKMAQYRDLAIPAMLDYNSISGLSRELQQKLTRVKPATIAQATLIQGMTPAALSLLIFRSREFQGA